MGGYNVDRFHLERKHLFLSLFTLSIAIQVKNHTSFPTNCVPLNSSFGSNVADKGKNC